MASQQRGGANNGPRVAPLDLSIMGTDGLDRLLTYDQLADALQVSQGTLRNWVSQQYVPHVKIGRAVRFDPRAIEEWLQRRAHPGRLRLRHENLK